MQYNNSIPGIRQSDRRVAGLAKNHCFEDSVLTIVGDAYTSYVPFRLLVGVKYRPTAILKIVC